MKHAFYLFWVFCLGCCCTHAEIVVYFSPSGGATDAIVREIHSAKNEVLVEAYSFTSKPIVEALVEANQRGVHVEAILDKSNERDKRSGMWRLVSAGVPILVDWKPNIAHNKVMIIDHSVLITGSFNFSTAAEKRNAENLLVIHDDPTLVASYLANYEKRKKLSDVFHPGDKPHEQEFDPEVWINNVLWLLGGAVLGFVLRSFLSWKARGHSGSA